MNCVDSEIKALNCDPFALKFKLSCELFKLQEITSLFQAKIFASRLKIVL